MGTQPIIAPAPPPTGLVRSPGYVGPERRNLALREHLVRRVRSEFEEMPGLCLTLAQARLLFGLEPGCCQRVLDELVRAGFLVRTREQQYARRDVGA
jgi:hypothetical protein